MEIPQVLKHLMSTAAPFITHLSHKHFAVAHLKVHVCIFMLAK